MSQQVSYPNAAYILSMIAGVFILLGGLLLALVGAAFTFFVFGIGAIIGLFGIVFGIIIIIRLPFNNISKINTRTTFIRRSIKYNRSDSVNRIYYQYILLTLR